MADQGPWPGSMNAPVSVNVRPAGIDVAGLIVTAGRTVVTVKVVGPETTGGLKPSEASTRTLLRVIPWVMPRALSWAQVKIGLRPVASP